MQQLEDDLYCKVCHSSWILVKDSESIVNMTYLYCPTCDKIYIPSFSEFKDTEINEEMKHRARIKRLKRNITEEDLIKLGKL